MDKVRSAIRLLALFSIFFIYKTVVGIIEKNINEVILWALITVVYIISLGILFVFVKKWENEQSI